jgi:hypothetical protein
LSAPVGPVWSALQAAASAFCPPLEVSEGHPGALRLLLHDPATGDDLTLRYRSERGLFLRTYFLVAETQISGLGPPRAGRLVLRRRELRWKRPKPEDAKRWSKSLSSPELRAALAGIPVERLALTWEPERATWDVSLETLSGSLTVTFFPPLVTPNPLTHDEAEAVVSAVRALRSASARTPA